MKALILLLAFAVGTLFPQSEPSSQPNKLDLRERIRSGDQNAITQAGATRDKTLIPDLRAIATSKRRHREGSYEGWEESVVRREAQIALARLGDRDALQGAFCFIYENAPEIGPVANVAKTIGGGFSVFAVATLLDRYDDRATQRFYKNYYKGGRNDDLVLIPPSYGALDVLPKLVEDPPTRKMIPLQANVELWKRWIQEHRTELLQKEPTGEGVDFSASACKKLNKSLRWE